MSKLKLSLFSALTSGLVFGFGLALAGMTDPRKVLAFLDIAGDWDPSLLFVLGAAVISAAFSFRFILRRPTPLLTERFTLPQQSVVDKPLVLGAILFGLGWGISGYCPGAVIASLATPRYDNCMFVLFLFAGSALHQLSKRVMSS